MALGDHHEVGQPRLRGQQVVIGAVQAAFVGVVADGEQVALRVVEEGEIHVRQVAGQLRQAQDGGDALGGAALHGVHLGALRRGPLAGVELRQLAPGRGHRRGGAGRQAAGV
ncbi:hypothetical protein D9M70_310990 [compost metagenome]